MSESVRGAQPFWRVVSCDGAKCSTLRPSAARGTSSKTALSGRSSFPLVAIRALANLSHVRIHRAVHVFRMLGFALHGVCNRFCLLRRLVSFGDLCFNVLVASLIAFTFNQGHD